MDNLTDCINLNGDDEDNDRNKVDMTTSHLEKEVRKRKSEESSTRSSTEDKYDEERYWWEKELDELSDFEDFRKASPKKQSPKKHSPKKVIITRGIVQRANDDKA